MPLLVRMLVHFSVTLQRGYIYIGHIIGLQLAPTVCLFNVGLGLSAVHMWTTKLMIPFSVL